MEINVSVQYNGGLLPHIMLSTRCVFFKKFRGSYRRCTIYLDYYDISTCTEDVQNMYRRCTIYLEY